MTTINLFKERVEADLWGEGPRARDGQQGLVNDYNADRAEKRGRGKVVQMLTNIIGFLVGLGSLLTIIEKAEALFLRH